MRARRHRCKSLPERLRRLSRVALPSDTIELARALLGTILVRDAPEGRCAVRIVETEAYPVGDPASHAAAGNTQRTGTMFFRRGHAYVYFIYGTSFCINVSSERAGVGAAVLLRAGEALLGLETMRARHPVAAERDICRGPGRLARALAVTRTLDGIDLCSPGPLWLAAGAPLAAIAASGRIGLSKEADRPLRFFEAGSPYLSGSARLNQG